MVEVGRSVVIAALEHHDRKPCLRELLGEDAPARPRTHHYRIDFVLGH
jgi:hypothetical protein